MVLLWSHGEMAKSYVWVVTCSDTIAPSHMSLAVREPRAVAADVEYNKSLKYGHLSTAYYFITISVETSGVFGNQTYCFLKEVVQRIRKDQDDRSALQHLVQRVSVTIHRGNAVSVLSSLG